MNCLGEFAIRGLIGSAVVARIPGSVLCTLSGKKEDYIQVSYVTNPVELTPLDWFSLPKLDLPLSGLFLHAGNDGPRESSNIHGKTDRTVTYRRATLLGLHFLCTQSEVHHENSDRFRHCPHSALCLSVACRIVSSQSN